MTERAREITRRSRVLFFFTNTFPFSPGEEFIEAEVAYLSAAFDKVILVPSFPYLRRGSQREIPENFNLIAPKALDGSRKNYGEVLGFCLRHPHATFTAARNSLPRLPQLRHMLEDFKLDLFSRMIVKSILKSVSALVNDEDDVVFYSYWLYAPARVAVELRSRLKRLDSRIVSRAHGYDLYSERRSSNYLPQRELLFENLDAVYSVSEKGQGYLAGRYPEFAEKISTRRLGVTAAHTAGNASRQELIVYTCAYLHPVKRIPLLIGGLAATQLRGIPVRWIHMGSSADTKAVEEIEGIAQEKLTPGSFEFLGNMSNDEVREQYERRPGFVFINTSESEGTPVSIMEALAQGLPVIATDVGGNRELISPELGMFDGLLDSNPSSEEIADAIEKLADASPQEFQRYVSGSLQSWATRWSSDDNYQRFATFLRKMAQPK